MWKCTSPDTVRCLNLTCWHILARMYLQSAKRKQESRTTRKTHLNSTAIVSTCLHLAVLPGSQRVPHKVTMHRQLDPPHGACGVRVMRASLNLKSPASA